MSHTLSRITEEEEHDLNSGKGYQHLILREYPSWILFLSENQADFGRAYVWSRRHVDMHQFDDVSVRDIEQLQCILGDYREALGSVLGREPDTINCEWLGNEVALHRGHGHMHFIPRYADPVSFDEYLTRDTRFGKRSLYANKELPEEFIRRFRNALREALPE